MRLAAGVALLLAGSADAAWAKPVRSPIEAVAALRGPNTAQAVKAVDAACRGRTGRQLKDHKSLKAEAKRLLRSSSLARRKAALDLHRCFSQPVFLSELLVPQFDDADLGMVAYAAEVAARLESATASAALLSRLEARLEGCTKAGLEGPQLEVCVWLTYAPGTGLGEADPELRARAGRLAATLALEAPYPKVREVAVETLAATRLKKHAETIAKLLEGERSGRFEPANSKALLRRFAQRAKTLHRNGS